MVARGTIHSTHHSPCPHLARGTRQGRSHTRLHGPWPKKESGVPPRGYVQIWLACLYRAHLAGAASERGSSQSCLLYLSYGAFHTPPSRSFVSRDYALYARTHLQYAAYRGLERVKERVKETQSCHPRSTHASRHMPFLAVCHWPMEILQCRYTCSQQWLSVAAEGQRSRSCRSCCPMLISRLTTSAL
jgi:hypothetical protein